MSISIRQNKYSELAAQIEPSARLLAEQVSNTIHTDTIATSILTVEELGALLPFINASKRIIIVGNWEIRQLPDIAALFTKLATTFGREQTYGVVTGALTDQELHGDIITDQSIVYHALCADAPGRFIVPTSLLQLSIPDKQAYQKQTLRLADGERISLSEVSHALVQAGYTRHRTSLETGSFRVRGEAIDIQHPNWEYLATLTFAGNTIERIVTTRNQRSTTVPRIKIPPASFPKETMSWQQAAANAFVVRPSTVQLSGQASLVIDAADANNTFPQSISAHIKNLARQIVPPKLTSLDRPLTYEQAFEVIGKLEVGKAAVHTDHGIGIFEGLQRRSLAGIEKEYVVIRYAQGDVVSVPVEFAHKITPYVGDTHPPIHRLHGTVWKKARKAAQVDAIAFAKELLSIAGERSHATRLPYTLSPDIEQELDTTFPHELTDDQVRTWQEVRFDLQQDIPMDRLVVGDVGFGKTEIAYRAARQAVANGKQVAILAPTTLLVQQHFDLFSERLPKKAGSVHLLSRFTSVAQQKKTRQAIISGEASIVVGTHALLSPKNTWKNLGLVVIDEEQRFGVKQKEQLKKVRAAVDVLSLSATPIPRTLSMALSGLRALSLIATAPVGRKSIETFVGRLTEERLKKAIDQELQRGGQVYVVAPKIRQLGAIKHQIEALFPRVPIAVAHGQLSDEALASIIHKFDAGEITILISSSIVEHGLDLPGANTMIVFHAPHFGLSELYQLRGRIGRRQTQGYAHFFYTQRELTPIQRERLTALTQASRLGSGWELARRDLEIRGAGNLLGAEQSGSVNAVGVQLYLDMVRQAASGEASERERADIILPFTALLPTTYIEDVDARTAWYVRLTRAKTTQELEKRVQELQRQFGEAPIETQNLLLTLRLQQAATAVGIQKIHTTKVTPPDEDPYDRIIVDTTNAPTVLSKLSSLGNWRLRGNSLTWDIDEVTPQLVENLTHKLAH